MVFQVATCLLTAWRYEPLQRSLARFRTPPVEPSMTLERPATTLLGSLLWLGGRESPNAARSDAARSAQAPAVRGSSGASVHALTIPGLTMKRIDGTHASFLTFSGSALLIVHNAASECGHAPRNS